MTSLSGTRPYFFNSLRINLSAAHLFLLVWTSTSRTSPSASTVGREIDLVEGGKQPYFISAANGELLSIAGLWDERREPETSESVLSCTLIVTAANDFTQRIHDRMPVLLGHHDFEAWLTGKAGVELLRPAPNDLLCMWPVSKRVNVSGRGDDDPSLTWGGSGQEMRFIRA